MVLISILVQAAMVVGVLSASSPPVGCHDENPPPSCKQVLADVKAAREREQNTWVTDVKTDPFYQSPDDLSSYQPGDLIRLEIPGKDILAKYQTPPGVTLYRMLYLSTDMENHSVPASAFLLLPYALPAEPLPLIAWAHGTSGMERHCAPSHEDDLYYSFEAPYAMALQGFAVVAPDYAGQGTDTTFHYLAGPAHAADIVHAVAAIRVGATHGDLPPHLTFPRWVVVGHSEGGLTAWATNEREAHTPSNSGFLGAVSIAPALANLRIIRENLERTEGRLGDTLLYPAYTLTAISRLNQSVDPADYLSAVGADRDALAKTGCFNTALASYRNLTFSDVFEDPSWLNASFAEAWQARTGVLGDRPLAKPMLLIAGLGDSAVPFTILDDAFHTQCNEHRNATVKMSLYPVMDHDAVAFVSQFEYFNWIRELFRGHGPENCQVVVMDMVNPDSGESPGDGGEVGQD